MRVHVHAPGPAAHGVVRHARLVARLAAVHDVVDTGHNPDLTHAHFTDALFGSSIEVAAAAYRDWAARARRPLVVTVHDVPDPAGRARRDRARCAGYAAVLAASDAVIVSAEHEVAKVADLTDRVPRHIGLPLPAEVPAAPTGRVPRADPPALVLLGYLYPGKGHREAIDLAAAVGRDRPAGPPPVVAAGAVSPGHDDLLADLRAQAARQQVPFHLTGHLSDEDFAALARSAGVPLVLNRTVSASGSLLSWLAGRRRPVTWAGPYSAEIDQRHPGCLLLRDTVADLVAATRSALADPAATRLPSRPRWPDVGAAHAAFYRSVLARGAGC
jgi:glycosyltransferase involved in cell wall biosynthesis